MTCEHLRSIEQAILVAGIRETFRGQAWSSNCREWVYFDCFIDVVEVRRRFDLADCVQDHAHRGTHDGEEQGLGCSACQDALMGYYERRNGSPVFPS